MVNKINHVKYAKGIKKNTFARGAVNIHQLKEELEEDGKNFTVLIVDVGFQNQ